MRLMHWTTKLGLVSLTATATLLTALAVAPAQAAVAVPALGAPQAVVTADGHLQVFAVGGGQIWQNWQDPSTGMHGGWVAPASPRPIAGVPAVVARAGGQVVDLFARTSAGAIVETWYDATTGRWGGWIALGTAPGTGDPRAVTTADGNDQVFVVAGGRVEENWFNPTNGHVGTFGAPKFAAPSAVIGRVAAAVRSVSLVTDVFARTTNGQVLETWYNAANGNWGGWINLGGTTTSDPAVMPTSPISDLAVDHDSVIVDNGASLAGDWFDTVTGHFGDWAAAPAPEPLVGPPALTQRGGTTPLTGNGLFDAVVRGTSGQLYDMPFDSEVPSDGWIRLNGSTTNASDDVTTTDDGVDTPDDSEHIVATAGTGAAVLTFAPRSGITGGWQPLQ